MPRSVEYRQARPNREEWDVPVILEHQDPAFRKLQSRPSDEERRFAEKLEKKKRMEAKENKLCQQRVEKERVQKAANQAHRECEEASLAKSYALLRRDAKHKEQLELKSPTLEEDGASPSNSVKDDAGSVEGDDGWVEVSVAAYEAGADTYEDWAIIEQV